MSILRMWSGYLRPWDLWTNGTASFIYGALWPFSWNKMSWLVLSVEVLSFFFLPFFFLSQVKEIQGALFDFFRVRFRMTCYKTEVTRSYWHVFSLSLVLGFTLSYYRFVQTFDSAINLGSIRETSRTIARWRRCTMISRILGSSLFFEEIKAIVFRLFSWIGKLKQESGNEVNSGSRSQMMSTWKCPIAFSTGWRYPTFWTTGAWLVAETSGCIISNQSKGVAMQTQSREWLETFQQRYLITWNFLDTLISRFYDARISRQLNFAILRNLCTLNDFNFAIFSKTLFI